MMDKEAKREAQRRANKKWYWKNREKKLAALKVWWQNTKETRHGVQAKYREANRGLLNAKRAAYIKDNPEKWRDTWKRSTAKHRTGNKKYIQTVVARQMVYYADPSKRIGYLVMQAKIRAEKLGRNFDDGCAAHLIAEPPANCACCGSTLNYARGQGKNRGDVPSIDRVNNRLGYVHGNVAIVCRDCNTRKRDHTLESLQQVAAYIEAYAGKQIKAVS